MLSISLRCSGCQARLKAPVRLLGQTRPCPGCGRQLRVGPGRVCQDAGPMLASDDQPAPPHRRGLILNRDPQPGATKSR
jgi:hypothetical protein